MNPMCWLFAFNTWITNVIIQYTNIFLYTARDWCLRILDTGLLSKKCAGRGGYYETDVKDRA